MSSSSSSEEAEEAEEAEEEASASDGAEAEAAGPEKDEGVWGHLAHVLPSHERQRLEREAVERAKEEETGCVKGSKNKLEGFFGHDMP